MEKLLESKNIPFGYQLCFNDHCPQHDRCMHYQAYLVKSADRLGGPAVYPTAWQDGDYKCFCEKRLVQKAWGFTQLYRHVPQRDKAEARQCVSDYFSAGCGPYYRYHHGENLLSPHQQQEIMDILAKFGPTDDLAFDHYVEDFDFS